MSLSLRDISAQSGCWRRVRNPIPSPSKAPASVPSETTIRTSNAATLFQTPLFRLPVFRYKTVSVFPRPGGYLPIAGIHYRDLRLQYARAAVAAQSPSSIPARGTGVFFIGNTAASGDTGARVTASGLVDPAVIVTCCSEGVYPSFVTVTVWFP